MTIEVDFDPLYKTLRGLRERAEDVSPAWEKWGDAIVEEEKQQFTLLGARFGSAWAALSPKYARWKALHHPGKPIMRLTDALHDSLTQRPMGVERINSHSAEFGTDVPYAHWHQDGTSKMPRRAVMAETPILAAHAKRLITQHIVHGGK